MRFNNSLSTILTSMTLVVASELLVYVPAAPNLPSPSSLPPSTTASLTTISSQYTASLQVDNIFHFRNLTGGSYVLDVYSTSHAFTPLRVDIAISGLMRRTKSAKAQEVEEVVHAWDTFRGNQWANKGEQTDVREVNVHGRKAWAINVRPLGEKSYFIHRQGFSPLSMLKNPMILIAGFTLLLVFGMPYLMDNMDPELRAEFSDKHKGAGAPRANPLQDFDPAAWLAGTSSSAGSGPGITKSNMKNVEERGVSR